VGHVPSLILENVRYVCSPVAPGLTDFLSMLAFLSLEVAKFPCLIFFHNQEFEVMKIPFETDVLHGDIFVISKKGEFHCSNPGPNVS
jgi:hypothetical protein